MVPRSDAPLEPFSNSVIRSICSRVRPGNREFQCACPAGKGKFVRHGSFYRTSDSRTITRWKCTGCKKTFSLATGHSCFRQHKRRVNFPLFRLLCSGVSLRRAAKILHVHRVTVARKLHFLAEQCRKNQDAFLNELGPASLKEVIFDEMETFEHTKFKPLSIPLAVTPQRRILIAEVAVMPAKGLLAAKSRKKYGPRKDERPAAISRMFKKLSAFTDPRATFKSDQNPSYPALLSKFFPHARHETTKGGRSCIVGQGELKKLGWDPIFSLNHSAAMLRANMNRLFRRTWCTTKTIQGLQDHLALYVHYHNKFLIKTV